MCVPVLRQTFQDFWVSVRSIFGPVCVVTLCVQQLDYARPYSYGRQTVRV